MHHLMKNADETEMEPNNRYAEFVQLLSYKLTTRKMPPGLDPSLRKRINNAIATKKYFLDGKYYS